MSYKKKKEKKNISKNSCVSIPNSTSCLLEKKMNKRKEKRNAGVLWKRLTSRGRATSYQNGKKNI